MKDKMDLSLSIAIGSSMQIALFATPLLVMIGWVLGKEMTLYFDIFQTTVLFISVLITNYLIMDGTCNYLEGALLLASYLIISFSFLLVN